MNPRKHFIELELNESICGKDILERIYKNKRIILPKNEGSAVVLSKNNEYLFGVYQGEWKMYDPELYQPISEYVLELPPQSDTPIALNDGECSYLYPVNDHVIFPDENKPLIVEVNINNKKELFVFIPDYGWYSINKLIEETEEKINSL